MDNEIKNELESLNGLDAFLEGISHSNYTAVELSALNPELVRHGYYTSEGKITSKGFRALEIVRASK